MTCSITEKDKRKEAFYIFYESVLKPDTELRVYAYDQECYDELMEWREEVIKYLDERKKEFKK